MIHLPFMTIFGPMPAATATERAAMQIEAYQGRWHEGRSRLVDRATELVLFPSPSTFQSGISGLLPFTPRSQRSASRSDWRHLSYWPSTGS
jgi:hypothetical protein